MIIPNHSYYLALKNTIYYQMTQIKEREYSIRLQRAKADHDKIKKVRNALQYKRGVDFTLRDTYNEILDKGIEALERELDINPISELTKA